jgi:hypothetical protein
MSKSLLMIGSRSAMLLLTIGMLCAPLAAQDTEARDEQDNMVVFTSPLIKRTVGVPREIRYSTSTKGGQLTRVTDRYALDVLAPSGETVFVDLRVTMTSNDRTPFAAEPESKVVADLAEKAKKKSKCQGCLHAEAVSIDGAWFEALGYDTVGTRSPLTSTSYFGNRNGKSYSLHASFIVDKIPMETVRSVVESMRLPEASAKHLTRVYEPFSRQGLTAQGLRGNFGPLARRHPERYVLEEMDALPTPGADDPNDASTAGYYSFEFADERGGKWLWMMCVPALVSDDRDAMEQAVLSGDSVSSVKRTETIQGRHGEIRRFAYQRKALFGGSVAESGWSVFREGTLYQIGTEGRIDANEAAALIAGLDAPTLRCEPIDAAMPPADPPSAGGGR